MFDTCVRQPMGLLVYITRTAVACLSRVIASLFMVACRQQRLISGFNRAACDSGSKYLCSVSLIRPLLGNGETPEREREGERTGELGLRAATAAKHPDQFSSSHTGPESRTIYCLWWKAVSRGSIDTRQVQREEGVSSVGNRNQRWGQMTASLEFGVRCSLSPLEASRQSESLFLPRHCRSECMCISACVHDLSLCIYRRVSSSVCMRHLLVCDTRVKRSVGHALSCCNHLSDFI